MDTRLSRKLPCHLAFCAIFIASAVFAAPPSPRAENVRAAVQRSLPYIEKVSVSWMQERRCSSCHNVTFLLWSHNQAAARGFEVDRTKLSEWTKWVLADSLSDRFWFKLRPDAMDSLKSDGLSDAMLAKLKLLEGKTYTTQKDYLQALEQTVGSEDLAAHKDRLLKAATLPNNGGGPDTLSQLLLAHEASEHDRAADNSEKDSYTAIRSLLLQWQEPDGSWQAQGQLPSIKWANENEMHQATTMWSLLALSADQSNDQTVVRSRQRALATLKTSSPASTLQSLALRLLIAHKFDEPVARQESLLKELLARQNPDGGWSWLKENKSSDAFSTGQALYALALVARVTNDPNVSRAMQFLLQTQTTDGSWRTAQEAINIHHRSLNVYTYWGTAWATIGLLQTLPPTEHSP